jgi:putative type II/III system pilus formation protein
MMIKSRLSSTLALAGASMLVLVSGSALAEVRLSMDQVRVVALKIPFKAISVGNPMIADATVIDENHVFIIGKEFGTTNLVAVDDEGNQIAEEVITVTTQLGTMVTVTRGAQQSTFTCNAGRCDTRPTPGDEATKYGQDSSQIQIREGLAIRAASTPNLAPQ